jgi:hypothetical protein
MEESMAKMVDEIEHLNQKILDANRPAADDADAAAFRDAFSLPPSEALASSPPPPSAC